MKKETCPACQGRISIPKRANPETVWALHRETCPGLHRSNNKEKR